MTHHHMDHSGGSRAFVAEGASVVVPGQARPFFEKMFDTQHKIENGRLLKVGPDVVGDEHQQEGEQERDAPPPVVERGLAEVGARDGVRALSHRQWLGRRLGAVHHHGGAD
jgi:glyoxylase-like metal-dependent hydrolase (beta-lactamase superfamily II)